MVKTKLDGQPSSLLAYMQVSDYKADFTLIYVVFLELGSYHYHLNFKLFDEKTMELSHGQSIPRY